MSSCQIASLLVWLQRESPGAEAWPSKSDTSERGAESGTGRTWQLAAEGDGLCSSDFTFRVISEGKAHGEREEPQRWGAGDHCSEKELKEPGWLAASFGVWGWTDLHVGVWYQQRDWMSAATEDSCWYLSSAVLYFLFVWSQAGRCMGAQQGQKARRGQGKGQVVKNWFFPEVLQAMQPEVWTRSQRQVTCPKLLQIYLLSWLFLGCLYEGWTLHVETRKAMSSQDSSFLHAPHWCAGSLLNFMQHFFF